MSNYTVLEMVGINKSFGDVQVLHSVDLRLHKGEVVALLGENGAGKSTLMKILAGIYRPDNGQITVEGKPLTIDDVKHAARLGIVLIHQELNLCENLDIADNIFLGREPLLKFGLVNKKQVNKEAAGILKMLNLDLPVETRVGDLSLATQQMVEIAKALSQKVNILIMDEPTSSLTIKETEVLFGVIRDLRSKGVTILYISHRLNEIYEIADRAVILKDGRNAGSLERDQLDHENIFKLMVGRDWETVPITEAKNNAKRYDFRVSGATTFRYPEKTVNFQVARGEILGIAGLAGAGRTELVNSLFGIHKLLTGSISLNGEPVFVRKPGDAISQGILLIPEDRRKQGIIAEMDVTDNITLTALDACARAGIVITERTKKIATRQSVSLGIKTFSLSTKLKHLSGGNQQKAAIAKWMSRRPQLIIFDEPTRGVDVRSKAEIYRIMQQLADDDCMVIMVSSDMEELMKVSHRILVMREGAITGELNRLVFSEEQIIRLAVAG